MPESGSWGKQTWKTFLRKDFMQQHRRELTQPLKLRGSSYMQLGGFTGQSFNLQSDLDLVKRCLVRRFSHSIAEKQEWVIPAFSNTNQYAIALQNPSIYFFLHSLTSSINVCQVPHLRQVQFWGSFIHLISFRSISFTRYPLRNWDSKRLT